MKHLNITILLTMLLSMVGVKVAAYDFAEPNNQGVTIYYEIINESSLAVTSGDQLYSGNVVIPDYVHHDGTEYSVTSIGGGAFYWCTGLTSVTIPYGVIEIYVGAFSHCDNLTSIHIPTSVYNIAEDAFCNCYSLSNIIIPEGVDEIGDRAFAGCESLSTITLPSSLDYIGHSAFQECTSLTSITIPAGVTSLYEDIFDGCSDLANILVASGNTRYDSRNECNAIIETSSNTLVLGCKNTVIPNDVKRIGERAFMNCSGLSSITIPNSVTSIGYSAFSGTQWYNNQPNGLVYAGKVAYEYKGTMPEKTAIKLKEGTLGIAECAFSGCTGLTSITIPNSVTSIGYSAFEGCSQLNDVFNEATTPQNLSFDPYFNYTTATLHVPAGTKATYEGDNKWKKFKEIVELPIKFADANVKALCIANWDTNGDGEFDAKEAAAVTSLEEVFKNKSITSFNELKYFTGLTSVGSFEGCTGLTSITIPNSVTSIGDYAFQGCSGLTSITIPNSVTSIGSSAFWACSSLTSVIIGNGVTSIGSWAFWGCTSLTSIDIPNSVTSIGDYAFRYCTGLTSITMGNGVTSIGGGAFSVCTSLTSITMGNGVTSIGGNAFEDCTGLTSITIPNSVTSIENYAFYGCTGLTSITIPESVTSIGSGAFYGCTGLNDVYNEATTPQALSSDPLFYYTKVTLHVPAGTKELYQAADYWKNFSNIVEMSAPSAINGVNAKDAKSFVGKIIKDNKIIIMKNGKKHSVSGQGM